MNIEDKAPLTGNYNRTDLRLVVVDMAQSPTPDGNQARTIAAADLFAQLEQGREVIPFEALTSLNWNVAAQPRVYLDLVADLAHITTKNAANGFYFELHARQPQGGGKKLTIDGVPVMISGTGNTLVIARYIGGVLDVHTDASAEAGKPVLLDESVSQTVLEGEYAEVWARFSGADEYVIERDGKPVPEATGAALLIKVAEPTAGAYEVIARNDYGETRSAAKFIKPGEAESVYLVTEPADTSVPAGTGFTLTAAFAGTPPPAIKCVEITNGQPTQTVSHTGTYQGTSLYTRQYQFIATNSYKVPLEVKPAEFAADGVTIIAPAITELQKKTFTAASKVITVTPIKQEQAAPIDFLIDDKLNNATWTNVIGKNNNDVEYRINMGDTLPVSVYPLSVGDRDIDVNMVQIRYAETLTKNASKWVSNQQAYSGSIQPVTDWIINGVGWIQDKNKLTSNTQYFQSDSSLCSSIQLPKISGAYVEAKLNYGGTDNTPILVLDDNPAPEINLIDQNIQIYGYKNTIGIAVDGVNLGLTAPFYDGDLARYEITSDLKLAIKVFSDAQWTTHNVVNYPVPLWLKGLGLSVGSSMVVTSKSL